VRLSIFVAGGAGFGGRFGRRTQGILAVMEGGSYIETEAAR